jgi:hypothetical protein
MEINDEWRLVFGEVISWDKEKEKYATREAGEKPNMNQAGSSLA